MRQEDNGQENEEQKAMCCCDLFFCPAFSCRMRFDESLPSDKVAYMFRKPSSGADGTWNVPGQWTDSILHAMPGADPDSV